MSIFALERERERESGGMESNGNWSGLRAEETLDCGCIRSFLLSFFEFFETCVRKSTSLVSSWFHLLLFFFISLRRRFPLPSFLPSVVPFHFEWPLPPSRELQPSSVRPPPSPTLFFAFADVFSRSEEKKFPQKNFHLSSLSSILRSTRFHEEPCTQKV